MEDDNFHWFRNYVPTYRAPELPDLMHTHRNKFR